MSSLSLRRLTRPALTLTLMLSLMLWLLLMSAAALQATEVTGAAWNGSDFIVAFSDSAGYAVDLTQSDSSQMVIHFPGAARGAGVPSAAIGGPNGRRAAITPADGGLRLTIAGSGRLGYSTLWRPYSHRLVIHTFAWDSLPYQEQQYQKGLLALEEGLRDRALELLGVAYATGDRRAGSVLGVQYARDGKDSLAIHYLGNPVDADDYLALADVYRRSGDSAAARTSEVNGRKLMAASLDTEGAVPTPVPARPDTGETANAGTMLDSKGVDDWRYVAFGTGALVLLLGLVIWAVGRSVARRSAAAPKPEPSRPQPSGSRPATITAPVAASPATGTPVAQPQPSVAERAEPAATTPPPAVPPATITAPVVSEPVASEERASTPVAQESSSRKADSDAVKTSEEKPAPEPKAPPVVEARVEHPVAEPMHGASPEPETPIPTQLVEVRQKIQSQRKDMPAPSESTVAAARRLHVSRDNVELRRKMADADARRGEES